MAKLELGCARNSTPFSLNRRLLRQRNDTRATMPIASRTLDVAQRYANRRLRVTRLHAQVQINDGVAGVARDYQPMVF